MAFWIRCLRMVKNHPPPVLRLFPHRRKPARAVGFVAAGEDELAGDHRVGFAQHPHGDVLEVELLERAARFPKAIFHCVFNHLHPTAWAVRPHFLGVGSVVGEVGF